jgi:hypothetical protein
MYVRIGPTASNDRVPGYQEARFPEPWGRAPGLPDTGLQKENRSPALNAKLCVVFVPMSRYVACCMSKLPM